MITFKEYIGWIERTRPELDTAWTKAEAEDQENPIRAYSGSVDDLLGKLRFIHPMTDNGRFYADLGLENSLDLLRDTGWELTSREKDKKVPVIDGRGESRLSDYCRLVHANGVASFQLYEVPQELFFYTNEDFGLVERFTDPESAEYSRGIPLEQAPDFSFSVRSAWLINPYGDKGMGNVGRDRDRVMENTVMQLMDRTISDGVPALFQNYVDRLCVINPPEES